MANVELPPIPFTSSTPKLIRSMSANYSGGKLLQVVEFSDPVWQVPMITKPMKMSERVLFEAFILEARDGLQTVTFSPIDNCVPRFYWGNSNDPALANLGNLVSVTGNTIVINSVTNGLTIVKGDMISLLTTTSGVAYTAMVRVTSAGAVAAGNQITLTVEPQIPDYILAGAVVFWKNPFANMRIVPGSVDLPDGAWPVGSFTLQEVPA